MSDVRKQALKFLGYIILGVLIIIPIWEQTSAIRFVGLLGFLIVVVNLIRLVTLSQQLIDDFLPPKGETETKPTDKFIGWLAMISFFGGLVWQVFEISVIDNTIEGTSLFLRFGFFGTLIGAGILFLLHRIQPTVFHDNSRRYSVYFGFIIGLGLTFPAGASYFNRTAVTENEQVCESFELERKSIGSGRGKSKYLFLTINNSEERFEVADEVWNSFTEGQLVKVCYWLGKLGYDMVTQFKTAE